MADDRRAVLVAMCGIPFAGKTTLANAISAHGGMHVLGVDAVVRETGIDIGSDGTRGIGWARAIAETYRQMRPFLVSGESVVFDHANHTRLSRDRCRALASECQAQFIGVWVDTPPMTAWERLQANRELHLRSDVPDAAFQQIVEAFEPPTDESDIVRWQDGMSVDDLMCAIEPGNP